LTDPAAQDLTRFDLDLRGLEIASVRVDGKQAKFTREGAVTGSGFVDQT
jgi:hypothetical protein